MSLSALGSAVRGKAQHARTSKLGHAGNIALMLGGSTRAFVLPMVHNNLKKYVIDELENRGAKVHTFMEVSLNDASSYHPGSFPPIIPSYFRKAIDVINPSLFSSTPRVSKRSNKVSLSGERRVKERTTRSSLPARRCFHTTAD